MKAHPSVVRVNWFPLIPLVLVVGLLEILVRAHFVPDYILPAPSQVVQALWDDQRQFLQALFSTGFAALVGLTFSCICGMTFAFLLFTLPILRKAIYPYALFFQTVPIIAIAPLLVIWFGFGLPSVVASAFIVSLFPIITSTLLGLESTDPGLEELFKLYRADRKAYWLKLKIPSALPEIFNGLRIGIGLAIIGAIVGEFIAGSGLGSIIDVARTQQRVDKVFAAVLLSSLVGIFAIFILDIFKKRALGSWHVSILKEIK